MVNEPLSFFQRFDWNPAMSKLASIISDWSQWLVENDEWENAQTYFRKLMGQKSGWRPAVVAVREIMQRAKTEEQGYQASLLLNEFLPAATPPRAIVALRRVEKAMYQRNKSPAGIERCLLLEVASSKIGREYLASLNKQSVK